MVTGEEIYEQHRQQVNEQNNKTSTSYLHTDDSGTEMNIGINMVQDQSIVELEESDSQSASSAGKQKDVPARKQLNKNSSSSTNNEIVPESPMLKQMRGAF